MVRHRQPLTKRGRKILQEERALARQIQRPAALLGDITGGQSIRDYVVDRMMEVRESLDTMRTIVRDHFRGFLPSGAMASWRRGISVPLSRFERGIWT